MSIYNPPQFGQERGNSQNLVQLAMAVKSFKMQEKQQKKAEASQRVDMLMKNPQLLLMQDPKELEKDLATLGIKITDQPATNPADAAKVQSNPPVNNPGTGDQPAGNIDPSNLAAVANATQGNKSGAQSASPASSNAANKASGGGVTSGIMSPQLVEQMAAKASDRMKENYGALAPIYAGAQSQIDASRHQAQLQMEIDTLRQSVVERGDIRAAARLSALAGHQVSDSNIRNMVIAAGTSPEAVQQALDVSLGNETGADKAKRLQNITKDLLSNTQIMDRLTNPLDAYKIASSVVYSGSIPGDIEMKPRTMAELKAAADYEHQLVEDYGTPMFFNRYLSTNRDLGLSPSQALPPGMLGLMTKEPIASRKVGAQETTARAAMVSALADKEKADNEHQKIAMTLSTKEYDALNDRIKLMIEADKAKKPWPDEIRQGYLNQLARATGLMPEQVEHWYKWTAGWEYKQDPASELAKAAAGGQAGAPKPKREPTFAERGGIAGAVVRTVPKDAQGNPILNPFELEHQLLTRGRDKALSYMKNIVMGTNEEKP